MKIFNKILTSVAVLMTVMGCVQEYLEVDPNKVPQASEIDVVCQVNQATNEVSFSITNKEMVPIWIVENEIVAGRKTTKDYTGNNLTLLFNERGEHTIHVKAYNAHGTSVGAKPVTFTTEGYVTYDKGIAGWDPEEDTNLWKGADKSKITFWYAPGWAQIDDPVYEMDDEGNFTVSLAKATTDQWQAQMKIEDLGISTAADKTYDFQAILNSSKEHPGVTVKLTSADSDEVFYFADRHALKASTDYLYQMVDMPGQDIQNLMLVFDFGGNADATDISISNIIFSEHQENHVIEAKGPTKWNAAIEANMWPAAKHDEISCWFADNDWNQIDDPAWTEKDGTYEVTLSAGIGKQQWQGQFFVNHTGIAIEEGKKYDFQFVLKSDADHPGVTIKPCNGVDGAEDKPHIADAKHVLKAGKEYIYQLADVDGAAIPDLKVVFDFGGGAEGSVVTVTDIIVCEHQSDHIAFVADPNENTLFDPAAAENLWLNANTGTMFYHYAPGWTQIDNPTITADGKNYFTLSLPTGTTDQWQAQVAFTKIGISTSAGKLYDFQVILNSNNDLPGVTIKLTHADDDNVYYFVDRHAVTGGKDFVYQMSNLEGKDMADLDLFFDFGGNPDGTEVIIKDIIIQEHRAK